MRGEPPPAPPPRVLGLRSPRASPPGSARSTARRPKRRHHLRQRCFSAQFFSLQPHLSSGFFPPSLSPKREGEEEKKMAKARRTFSSYPHTTSPLACFPDSSSPGPNLGSRAGRGHFPATARSEATEGGAGRVPAARSPAGAAGAGAAVADRPPLPASTQATCATSCRRGVSTAPNRNRRRRCRRRRCAAPARLPLGAR